MTPPNPSSRRQWVLAALDQYEGRLTRYARRLLRDEHAARDAVQHAFLRLCEQDPDKLGERVAAWLFTVCRNKARDIARESARELARSQGGARPLGGADVRDADAGEVAGRELEPPAVAEASELAACVRKLIDRLPDAQRETLDLWQEGFSYRQIGEITERSEGAVRVTVHRAIVRLREHPLVKTWLDDDGAGAGHSAPSKNGKSKPAANQVSKSEA